MGGGEVRKELGRGKQLPLRLPTWGGKRKKKRRRANSEVRAPRKVPHRRRPDLAAGIRFMSRGACCRTCGICDRGGASRESASAFYAGGTGSRSGWCTSRSRATTCT